MSAGLRRLVIALAALASVGLTARLGLWQLSRADEKQTLQALVDQRDGMAPVDYADLLAAGKGADLLHRRVQLRGHWLAKSMVYLDNRPMNARVGFYVVGILRTGTTGPGVLVVRGWAPRNFLERSALPPVDTPAGEVEVYGRVVPPPSRLYEFSAADEGPIRQNLDLSDYAREMGQPLLALAVQQLGGASEGLLRDWPRNDVGLERHLGYAFQWFALAGLIVVLYFWFQIVQPYRARRRRPLP